MIGISKPRCQNGEMQFSLRGKEADYDLTVRLESDSTSAVPKWTLLKEIIVDHRSTAKTLPKTDHEKDIPNSPSINIPSNSNNPNDPKVASAFIFSGYLDGYAEYNLNRPGVGSVLSPQNNLRLYDANSNQFVLSLAEITIKHVRKETTFLLDLDFGSFADTNTQTRGFLTSGGPSSSASDEISKHIGQAIFTYTPHSASHWIFEAGKMPTHIGLELMKAKDNWNYTRSAVFSFALPLWHTGIHVGDAILHDRLSLNAYLYNGWNSMTHNNLSPTYGTQVKWTPSEQLTAIYNYIGGPEQAGNQVNWRQVHEVNFTFTVAPTVSAATDFVYGREKETSVGNASWYGAQVGLKWQTSPKFYLSPRAEIYRDPQGYTLGGVGQTLTTYTLTESIQVSEGFEMRLEERFDHSTSADRFLKSNDVSPNQPTVLAGLLYTL